MALNSAGPIIEALKKQLGLDQDTYTVIQIWEKELKPLLNNAELTVIKKSTLIVEVESSAHFQELMFRRKEIIGKINQYFGGKKVVKEIKIQLKK